MVYTYIELAFIEPPNRNVGEIETLCRVTGICGGIEIHHRLAGGVNHVACDLIAIYAAWLDPTG